MKKIGKNTSEWECGFIEVMISTLTSESVTSLPFYDEVPLPEELSFLILLAYYMPT